MTEPADSKAPAESDFDRAVERHRAGRLDEASGLYERVLTADPNHYEACRLLGLLTFQRGQADDAVRRLQEAKRLLDARLITDAEYEAIKAKIVST